MIEKKNLAVYIERILSDHSDTEHTLTKKQISDYLFSEYNLIRDPRSVSSALDWMLKNGFSLRYRVIKTKQGEKKTDWYISREQIYKSGELISLSLITCPYLTDENVKELASDISSAFDINISQNSLPRQNGSKYDLKEIIKSINAITKAIKDNIMLYCTIFEYQSASRKHFEEKEGMVREYLIKPISLVVCFGVLHLYCELADTGIYRFLPLHRLNDLRPSSIKFVPYENVGFTLPSNKPEAYAAVIGAKERAVIRIRTERAGEFTEHLGGEYKVICSYSNLTEIEIYSCLRALKPLILSFGADIEVLSPTKLRRAVATELQGALVKYSEIRKLYGTR